MFEVGFVNLDAAPGADADMGLVELSIARYRLAKARRVTTAERRAKAAPPKNRPAWRRVRSAGVEGREGVVDVEFGFDCGS